MKQITLFIRGYHARENMKMKLADAGMANVGDFNKGYVSVICRSDRQIMEAKKIVAEWHQPNMRVFYGDAVNA